MKTKFNQFKKIATGALMLGVLSIAVVNAQGPSNKDEDHRGNKNRPQNIIKSEMKNEQQNMARNGKSVAGIVTAINGNTLTVSETIVKRIKKSTSTLSTTTTYTVDASNAIIMKSGATTSLSVISLNDKVLINGTASGTLITAKIIHDGVGQKNWNKDGQKKDEVKFMEKFKNFFNNLLKKNK